MGNFPLEAVVREEGGKKKEDKKVSQGCGVK